MTRTNPIRRNFWLAIAVVLLSITLQAQYPAYEPPRWHVNGFAGFDLTHTSQSQTPNGIGGDQLLPLGDLRLNGDGFLLDPRFLHINAGLDYQKGVNQANQGDLGMGGINAALSTSFLPNSHIPLRVTYTRSNHGVTGLGLDQNSDDSRLDVQWNVFRQGLPHITTSFQDYSSTVHVASSFSDRTFDEKGFNIGASDNWKNWQWTGSFALSSGGSNGIAGISPDSNFQSSSRAGGLTLYRSFSDNKAHVRFENRELWLHNHLGGDGSDDSREITNTASYDMQVTPKVTLGTGYANSQVEFSNNFNNVLLPGVGTVQSLLLISATTNTFSGHVDYRPWNWLRLSQEIRDTLSTPIQGAVESQTSFTDTATTIEADHRWRGFDLMGSYTGRYQITGTSLDNTPDSWSNSFIGRIGWGDVRSVRLTASGQNTHLNLVEQIGGFSDEKRAAFEAETHRVRSFRLRASADYMQVELLNISGNTRNKILTYAGTADHRYFTLGYSYSFMDGAGALFPLGLLNQQFLVIPLPISQLLGTPLLDRTTHAQTVTFFGKPRKRLEVGVSWRIEDTVLPSSEQTFNVLQADARYRLGKFSLEGGYYRNLNDVTVITGLTGTRLAVWYFRIGRDFKVF